MNSAHLLSLGGSHEYTEIYARIQGGGRQASGRACTVVDAQGQHVKRARTLINDVQGVIELIDWARPVAVE